jgi:hypothetical protein
MSEGNSVSLTIGGEVKTVGLAVAGKLFVFNPSQMQFLLNLQKLKNVTAASLSVDKTEEWGQNFLRSRKFRDYISCKMQEFSVKNGLTVEWWYQFGKWSADGCKEYYQGHCPGCEMDMQMNLYEVETYRSDDMSLEMPCPACFFKPISLLKKSEEFKPTREQIGAWQELGARLIPKVERVHHQFENVEIKFESEEAANG